MYAYQHTLPGGHFLVEDMGVRLSLPQVHPGQGGFLHSVDVAEHVSVVSKAEAPVTVV